MKRKLCFLTNLIYLSFSICPALAQTSEYLFRQPDVEVNAFAQDAEGYIWMATSHGLARFDGSGYLTWTATKEEGGLQNDNVLSLLYDSDGTLWVGTECGYGYMNDGWFTHNGEAVYNPVSSVKEMDDSHILMLGKDGLVKFRKDDVSAVAVYSSVGTSWLENVLVTDKQEVWFISRSNDSTFVDVLDSDLRLKVHTYMGMNMEVSGLCQLPDGDVYMATSAGVGRYDHDTDTVVEVTALKSHLGGAVKIHFMLPYKENQLLFGVEGKGFFAYVPEDGSVRHIIRQQTLSSQKYVCFVDDDDRIWLSDRESGIRTYNPKGVYVHFNPQGEDVMGEVAHLYMDKEGFLWVNKAGTVLCLDAHTGEIVSEIGDEASCRVSFVDSSGRLWAIFGQNEIRRYALRGGRARLSATFETEDGVFSISEGQNGKMWFASVRKLYVIDRNDMIDEVVPDMEPAFSLLLSEPLTHRVFMFSVYDGLYEIHDDETVTKLETGDIKGISYVIVSTDGALWLGTYNEGLVRFDETTGDMTRFGSEAGLTDLSIKSIVEDKEGNIWFSTRSNVVKYNVSDGSLNTVHDDWFVEGRSYGLVSAACGPDGIIYFGGSAGITRVDPCIPFPEAEEMRLDIQQILVSGKPITPDEKGLVLGHEHGMLNFRFSGLDYDSGPYLSYSYMLEGHDRNWTTIYGKGSAVYTHLPAGNYIFRARVKGADGVWSSNEIVMPVRVKARPLSVFAVIMIVLCVSALAFSVVLLWRRNLAPSGQESEDDKEQEESEWYDTSFFTDADRAFVQKVRSLLEENLESEKFTVNDLAQEMNMSYSSLYAKMKSLTGGTPQYFMTAHRMRRAEAFLKSGLFSVSEVGYKVGSSSPMTFSREFKKYFGYPPSTLLKDKVAEKDSDQNL